MALGEVKDLVRLPDTRALRPADQDVAPRRRPITSLSTSAGAVVRESLQGKVEPAGCGPQRCHAPYGDFNTAVEDVAADDMAGGLFASRASVTTRLARSARAPRPISDVRDAGACHADPRRALDPPRAGTRPQAALTSRRAPSRLKRRQRSYSTLAGIFATDINGCAIWSSN